MNNKIILLIIATVGIAGLILLLRKKEPALGPELVINGNFAAWTDDDPDGWALNAEQGAGAYGTRDPEVSQVASGQSHTDAGGETGGMCNIYQTLTKSIIMSQTLTLVVGRKYRLSINVDNVTTGKILVHNVGTLQWPVTLIDTPGVHSLTFVCTQASTWLLIEDYAVDVDVTIDDVSIREVIASG